MGKTMFDVHLFDAKNWVFKFDYQKFVPCLKMMFNYVVEYFSNSRLYYAQCSMSARLKSLLFAIDYLMLCILRGEDQLDFEILFYSYGYEVKNATHCRTLIRKNWRGHVLTILGNAQKSGAGSMPPLQPSEKLLIEIFSNKDIPDSFMVKHNFEFYCLSYNYSFFQLYLFHDHRFQYLILEPTVHHLLLHQKQLQLQVLMRNLMHLHPKEKVGAKIPMQSKS